MCGNRAAIYSAELLLRDAWHLEEEEEEKKKEEEEEEDA
jgi:hypothetical protein